MQGHISGHQVPCGSSSFQVTAGLVGIKQLTRRTQVEHFMYINYHFPACCFHSSPILKGDVAVESDSLFLCSEYLLRAAITVYCCHHCILLLCTERAGACSSARCTNAQGTWQQSPWPVGSQLCPGSPAGTCSIPPRASCGCAIAPLPGPALTPGRSKMFQHKPYWQNWKFYCLTSGKQSF